MSPSAIRNIDHTVLLCRRLPETRAFYRDVMGFPVETSVSNASSSNDPLRVCTGSQTEFWIAEGSR